MFISLWASRLTIIMPTPPVKKLNRLLAYHRKSALLLFVLRYYCILNIVCSFRFELPSNNCSIVRTPTLKQLLQSWISSIPSIIFHSRPSTNRCNSVCHTHIVLCSLCFELPRIDGAILFIFPFYTVLGSATRYDTSTGTVGVATDAGKPLLLKPCWALKLRWQTVDKRITNYYHTKSIVSNTLNSVPTGKNK